MIMTRAHINCKICSRIIISEHIIILFTINSSWRLNRHYENIVLDLMAHDYIKTNNKDSYAGDIHGYH